MQISVSERNQSLFTVYFYQLRLLDILHADEFMRNPSLDFQCQAKDVKASISLVSIP